MQNMWRSSLGSHILGKARLLVDQMARGGAIHNIHNRIVHIDVVHRPFTAVDCKIRRGTHIANNAANLFANMDSSIYYPSREAAIGDFAKISADNAPTGATLTNDNTFHRAAPVIAELEFPARIPISVPPIS